MKARRLFFLFFLPCLCSPVWAEEGAEDLFRKGIAAVETGDYEAAIESFKKTIAVHPEHIPSYVNMGYVYRLKGMWDEAIAAYRKALEINPSDARIVNDLGFSLYKKGLLDEAIAEFEKAIELGLGSASAYQNLGVAYMDKKVFGKAIPALKSALESAPDDPVTHFNLGRAYKELGKPVFAADHYYKAGVFYLQVGYREGALTAYEDMITCSGEISDLFLKRLYEDNNGQVITQGPAPRKGDKWYVLLDTMSIRDGPSTDSGIVGHLTEGAQFQIVNEQPEDSPLNRWLLVKTKAGLTGWLCGVYRGIVKYDISPPSGAEE